MLREKTDRAWLSCLLQHLARQGANLFFQPRSLHRATAQQSTLVKTDSAAFTEQTIILFTPENSLYR